MPKRSAWFNIISLGLVSMLTDLGSEMIYPLLPILFTNIGLSAVSLGLIEGIAESTASFTKIWFGLFSDRVKKRKIFAVIGYSLSTVGKLLLPLAAGWNLILGGRFLDRFGKGIRTAPRDALLAENATEGKTGAAFGLHRALDTTGAVLGSALAWVLLTRFTSLPQHIFYIALIPSVLAVLALILVKETKQIEELSTEGKKLVFKWSLLPRELKVFFIASIIFTLGNSSNLFLILRSINIGFLPATALLLYLTYNLSHALLSYPAGAWSDRIGRKTVLVLGYLLYGLIYLAFAFTTNKLAYFLLFIAYGFYGGMTEGVEKALVADHSPKELKGTFQGMHATLLGVTLLPASLLAGWLWQTIGPATPFYFSALTSFISLIILIRYLR